MSKMKLKINNYMEFERWFNKMMDIRKTELSEHLLTDKIPEKIEFNDEIYKWNQYKDNWFIQREVDWKEFTKTNNIPLLDKPVACIKIISLKNAVSESFK